MKKYLALIIALLVLFNFDFLENSYAQNDITVKLNGNKITFDAKPYVKSGRVLVPFRKILEAFGAEVSWVDKEQIVIAKKNSTEIFLEIGADYAYVNANRINLDSSSEISDNRTFVPLRFISESLGSEVKWDEKTKTVSIEYNNDLYKLGQEGTYKGLTFSIDTVDTTSESGILKIIGKVSSGESGMVVEAADEYGYVLSGEITITGKSGAMYDMEVKFNLPVCHNFTGKYLIIKQPSDNQMLVKVGEYEI